MVREFKEGNWSGVWYPMIPPFYILITGTLATVLSLPAMFAGKLVSILFFASSVFPLYHILKPFYGHRVARSGCLLLIFCSRLLRDSAAPLLDSGKMFLFLLCVCLLITAYRQRPQLSRALILGGAAAGLALVRGEGLALALPALAAYTGIEIYQRCRMKQSSSLLSKVPWHSCAAALLFLLMILPWAMYMYNETGYPVLDRRQLDVIQRLPVPESGELHEPSKTVRERFTVNHNPQTTENNFLQQSAGFSEFAIGLSASTVFQTIYSKLLPELFKGVHQYYIPLYIIGIVLLIKNRQWRGRDWLLGGLFLAHALIVILAVGRIWTQARYILPATPLLFGWAAVGGLALIDWGREKIPVQKQKIIPTIITLLALIMVFNGNHRAFQFLRRSRPNQEYFHALEAAQWMREKGKENMAKERSPIKSTQRHYHAHRRPLLLTANRRIAFLGETDAVFPDMYHYGQISIKQVLELCSDKTIDFIIIDRQWKRFYEIDTEDLTEQPEIVHLKNFGEDSTYSVDILLVQPGELKITE